MTSLRQNEAPEMLRHTQETFAATQMKPDEWKPFLIDYTGKVDETIVDSLKRTRASMASWKGSTPSPAAASDRPIIADDADLDKQPLAALEAEIERVQKVVNSDLVSQRKFTALSAKIAAESAALGALTEKYNDAAGAKERSKSLQADRKAAHMRVFAAISAEEEVLTNL